MPPCNTPLPRRRALDRPQIQERLRLPDDDLQRLLHSLVCAKYKIIKKDPDGKSIGKSDKFAFNNRFTDKMRRIKIPLPPLDEKKKVRMEEAGPGRAAGRAWGRELCGRSTR